MQESTLEQRIRDEHALDPRLDVLFSGPALEWGLGSADEALSALEVAETAVRTAEARRMGALLDAYQAGLDDLAERFGRQYGGREGMGAKAFIKQAAMILQVTEGAAAHLLDAGLEARIAMPRTWARFLDGRTTWRAVATAVQQSVGLREEEMPAYDEAAAELVQQPAVGRLKDLLRRAAERLRPETAVERRRLGDEQRRMICEPLSDGQAAMTLVGPAPELVALDQAVTKAAIAAHGHEGETRSIPTLRFDIAIDLLLQGVTAAAEPSAHVRVPQRKGIVPTLALTVPALAWLGHTTEQAVLGGYGPIDLERARRLAAQAPRLVRILTDPVTGVRLTMDQKTYAVPPDLRRWLGVLHETCGGLGCRRPEALCDIDHALEWHDGGGTNADNLVPLCRPDHLLKSTGLWTETVAPDGNVRWTSPWGRRYEGAPAERSDPVPPEMLRPADDPPWARHPG